MRIFFCGGGTMGPVTPLLATIEKLKALKPEAVPVWIGTRKGVEREPVVRAGIEYHAISAAKLRRYFDVRTLFVPFIAAAAVVESAWLIWKFGPKAVVVSGSYVQVPLVMVARMFGVPVVLLQLDVIPGLANRISAFDAKKIVTALPLSPSPFGKFPSVAVGSPVRRLVCDIIDPSARAAARSAALKRWGIDGTKPTILVLGGGTGAQSLNEKIIRVSDGLLKDANLLIVAGKGKIPVTGSRDGMVIVEFLNEELAEAFAVADLAVSRAGFGTISELGVLGIPAVLVPLVGQQEQNAAYLDHRGAAVAIKGEVSDQAFQDTVLRLLNDRDRRLEMGRAAANIFPPGGAEKLAQVISDTIQ